LDFPLFGLSAAASKLHKQIAVEWLFRRSLTAAPFCLPTLRWGVAGEIVSSLLRGGETSDGDIQRAHRERRAQKRFTRTRCLLSRCRQKMAAPNHVRLKAFYVVLQLP
jgi:hypothetical protein